MTKKHSIGKLLCNNKDADQQRDLDTEQMRNMVLQALEQRKQRFYVEQQQQQDDDHDDEENGGFHYNHHKTPQHHLEMEEAIQIAETIQGLAETLTALKTHSYGSVLGDEAGQFAENYSVPGRVRLHAERCRQTESPTSNGKLAKEP